MMMWHKLLIASALAALATPAAAQDTPPPASAPPSSTSGTPASDADLAGKGDEPAAVETSTGKSLQERIRAVSRRVFLKRQRFELAPNLGFTANDALNRAWSLGLRGSYHFNEELALDFGGGGVVFNEQLQDVRIKGGDLSALDDVPRTNGYGYVDGGVTFSPFYGKFAVMAETVIHFDGFVSAGLGAVFDSAPELFHPSLELGIGARVFLNRWLTVRADVRNYTYPQFAGSDLSFPSALILTIGAGIHIPFDFDYSTEIIGAKS